MGRVNWLAKLQGYSMTCGISGCNILYHCIIDQTYSMHPNLSPIPSIWRSIWMYFLMLCGCEMWGLWIAQAWTNSVWDVLLTHELGPCRLGEWSEAKQWRTFSVNWIQRPNLKISGMLPPCGSAWNQDITIIHGECNYVTMYYSDDRKSASWEWYSCFENFLTMNSDGFASKSMCLSSMILRVLSGAFHQCSTRPISEAISMKPFGLAICCMCQVFLGSTHSHWKGKAADVGVDKIPHGDIVCFGIPIQCSVWKCLYVI